MAAGYCYSLGIKSNDFFLKDNKKAFILWLNVPKVTAYIYSYFMGYIVKGWSSIMLSIWFCSGCVLMGLGIVGEYIGKIYIETKERPRYNIESILMD